MIEVLRSRERSILSLTVPAGAVSTVAPDTQTRPTLRSASITPVRNRSADATGNMVRRAGSRPDRTSTDPEGPSPVANIKSQIKRNRQTEKRRLRNRSVRAELKTRIRSAVEAAESGENVAEATAIAMKRIDKAGDRRGLHPNAAARRKSRLQKRLNGLSS